MYLYQALPWKLISNYLCIHFVRYAISTCICTTLSQLATSKLEFLLVIGFNICSMLYTKSLGTKNKTWGLCLMMKQGFILKIHRAFPSSKLSAHDLMIRIGFHLETTTTVSPGMFIISFLPVRLISIT